MHGTTEAAMLMLQFGTLAVLILPMVAQAVPKLGSALEDKKYEKYVHIPIDQKLHHKLFVALKLPERFTSVSEQAAPRQSLTDLEAQISAYKYKRTELQLPVISIASKMLHVSPAAVRIEELEGMQNKDAEGGNRPSPGGGEAQAAKGKTAAAYHEDIHMEQLEGSGNKDLEIDSKRSSEDSARRWGVLDIVRLCRGTWCEHRSMHGVWNLQCPLEQHPVHPQVFCHKQKRARVQHHRGKEPKDRARGHEQNPVATRDPCRQGASGEG